MIVYLFLKKNMFYLIYEIGTIPSTLGNLSSLYKLLLFNNNLTGAMPSEVCDLRTTTLSDLFADCSQPVEVECSCCTECY